MNALELNKIQQLREQLGKTRVILQQMLYTVDQIEKELDAELKKGWEVL